MNGGEIDRFYLLVPKHKLIHYAVIIDQVKSECIQIDYYLTLLVYLFYTLVIDATTSRTSTITGTSILIVIFDYLAV